jgi:electron transfer flavoprotein alpha subunit
MKILLVAEQRDGHLQDNYAELLAFAELLGSEPAMFLVGGSELPRFAGTLYLADSTLHGEYNPGVHKDLLKKAIAYEQPDLIVFLHSSYGWDLAPRLSVAIGASQISEVVSVDGDDWQVPACNSKLRRTVKSLRPVTVLTIQAGAFAADKAPAGEPTVVHLNVDSQGQVELLGYEAAQKGAVDLSKASIIVSAGRGVGKPENIALVASLAKALGGEYGASRPVVDAEWVEHNRQVGTTGSTVAPKLYVACGISGAVQHLAGMKKSEFVVAVNTDRDAPIGEVADVFVVADLKQFLPVLTERLQAA